MDQRGIKKIRRVLAGIWSMLLAVCGVVVLMPSNAMKTYAAGTTNTYDVSTGNVVISGCNSEDTYVISGSSTSDNVQISVPAGVTAHVVFSSLDIDVSGIDDTAAVLISGAGSVEITLSGDSTLKSGRHCAGLQNGNTGSLTIKGTGSLTVVGGAYAAGIGSGSQDSAGNIVISGGTVTATGGGAGAGIGSGNYYSSVGNITISGGNVTATGSYSSAGIGTGNVYCSAGNITISGGTVTATGGSSGAGIGNGYDHCNVGNIVISGGTVQADGGRFAAGIGCGADYNSSVASLTICGGTVYSAGGKTASGIGDGGNSSGNLGIVISGDSQVYVSGGTDDNPYGPGAGIGGAGRNSMVPGTERGDFSGLFPTGYVKFFPAGTDTDQMKNSSIAPISVLRGTFVPARIKPQIDHMKIIEDKINAALAQDGPQTVYIKGYDTLSLGIMELLEKNPRITLVSEFNYKGIDFKITIPGSAVKTDPSIPWYGPKYLYPNFYIYGTDTAPAFQTYLTNFS